MTDADYRLKAGGAAKAFVEKSKGATEMIMNNITIS
jgi:hypothetical protein